MTSALLLTSAFGFGIAHAFEPDHMAAVSTFVADRPKPREALSFGLKWATGHGVSLLILGSTLYLLRRAVEGQQPMLFASGVLDRFVGFVLLCLGISVLARIMLGDALPRGWRGWRAVFAGRGAARQPLEEQLVAQQVTAQEHSHDSHSHVHHPNMLWGGSVLMGLLHGAAGTGAFIGQAMVAVSSHYSIALLYTLLFSLGVLVAMGFYAALFGGVLTWGEKRSVALLRGARALTGVLTCAIGVCLMLGIELPGLFDGLH